MPRSGRVGEPPCSSAGFVTQIRLPRKVRYESAHPSRIAYSHRMRGGDLLAAAVAGRSVVDRHHYTQAAWQGRILSSQYATGRRRFPPNDLKGKRRR